MDVATAYLQATERWEELDVPLDAFTLFVEERTDADLSATAIDLYLTCACVRGDPGAVACFEREYFGIAREAIARLAPDPAVADEALQSLRVRLFVADSKDPGIAGYAGRGSLAGWVRIAATRIVLSLLRSRRDHADESELERFVAPDSDPERALDKRRYGEEANGALREAFANLTVRERNLLRQHFVDGLGIDRLGALYGVHRATAARWLEKARSALEHGTREILEARLGIGGSTADGIIQMLRSELHISLASDRST